MQTVTCKATCNLCQRKVTFQVRARTDPQTEDVVKWMLLARKEAQTAHALAGGLMCEGETMDLMLPVNSKTGWVGQPET